MVHAVAPGNRPQPNQVQVRVLDLQRIEGPFDEFETFRDGIFALGQLKPAAQAVIAPAIAHSQHVRMQVSVASASAGNGKNEAYELVIPLAVESADDLAADLLAYYEHAQRHQVDIVEIPHFPLQRNAGLELSDALALADDDPVCRRRVSYRLLSSKVW